MWRLKYERVRALEKRKGTRSYLTLCQEQGRIVLLRDLVYHGLQERKDY